MEIKFQVIIMQRAFVLLALHLLTLARLSNNKQVNRLEANSSPTCAKLSNIKVKFHHVLQVSKTNKKVRTWNTQVDWVSYYNVLARTLQYDEYEQESGCGVWRERHVTKRCLAVLGEEERV
ncbi:unnamed protein product [Sphagnum tenellum]